MQVRTIALIPADAVQQTWDNECKKSVKDDINYFYPVPLLEAGKKVFDFFISLIHLHFPNFLSTFQIQKSHKSKPEPEKENGDFN